MLPPVNEEGKIMSISQIERNLRHSKRIIMISTVLILISGILTVINVLQIQRELSKRERLKQQSPKTSKPHKELSRISPILFH